MPVGTVPTPRERQGSHWRICSSDSSHLCCCSSHSRKNTVTCVRVLLKSQLALHFLLTVYCYTRISVKSNIVLLHFSCSHTSLITSHFALRTHTHTDTPPTYTTVYMAHNLYRQLVSPTSQIRAGICLSILSPRAPSFPRPLFLINS